VPIIAETRMAIEGLANNLNRQGARVQQCLPEVNFAEQYRFADETFWLIGGTYRARERAESIA
jgi:hypothetical protein